MTKISKLSVLLSLFLFSYAQAQEVVDEATLKTLYDYALEEVKQASVSKSQLLQELSTNPGLRANVSWLAAQIGDPNKFAVLHDYEIIKDAVDFDMVSEKRNPVYSNNGFYLADHPKESIGKHFILGHSANAFVMLSVYPPTGLSVFGAEFTFGRINLSVAYKIEDFTDFERLSPEQEKIGRLALANVSHQDMDRHFENQLMRYRDVHLFPEFFDANSKLYGALLFRDYLDEHQKSIASTKPSHPYTKSLGEFPQMSFFNAANGEQHLVFTSELIGPHLDGEYKELLRDFLRLPKALLAGTYRTYHKVKASSGTPTCTPISKLFN